jgi:serine/threonine-protein kinase
MSIDRDLSAWLATLAADTADTIRSAPSTTIVPTLERPSTGGRRALALLAELADRSPTATAQLKQGELIAEGGMGQIHIAEQVAMGRVVAVKTLKPSRRDPGAALDLLREAWLTGTVEHPNVVPVHHVGLDEQGQPQIVMKRIEGVEWSALIGDAAAVRERFGATDLLAWNLGILMQVLNALHFAHSRGIVHRDLKPANVMIGEFGEVYLLDWGIAVSLRDDGSGRLPLAKDQKEMAGTPCYMAPEMLGREGGPALSERTDIYLAGSVLFEVVTGAPPHDGDSALAVVASVIQSKPELPASAPAELGRICGRAMRPDPDERFESADELRQALQAYLEHRGSQRLADLAQERLVQLEALAATAADANQREEVYRLFGACRFGFHEALLAWRGNDAARAGLDRATVIVAELELRAGDPRAAVALLSELEAPPAELLARARSALAEQSSHHAALEKLRAQHDETVGERTRTFLATLFGSMFTIFPLLAGLFPGVLRLRGHAQHIGWSLGFLVLVVAFGFWARDTLSKTVLNRRSLASMIFLFTAQAALFIGAWRLDMPDVDAEIMMMFLWVALSGMFVIAVDRRLAPCALGYLAAFAFACVWPAQRFFAMAAGNFIFLVTSVYHWWPSRFGWSDEEREALGRKPRRKQLKAAD